MLHSTLERFARWLFWPTLIFSLTMAVLPHPPHTPLDRFGDKVMHMLAFLAMTLLAQAGYGKGRRWYAAACLSLFGAAIEVIQAIPVLHRDSDARDWVADSIAIVLTTLVFIAIDRLQTRAFPLGRSGDD